MTDTARSARAADAVIFGIEGAAFATWAARVPAVRSALDLSSGEVGLALLALACGSIAGLTTSGALSSRYGSRQVIRAGLIVYCLALPLAAFTDGLTALAGGLAVFGFGKGLTDVGANAQAVRIERSYPGQIMGSFHALFSAGGLVGAAFGAVAAGIGLSVRAHFALVGATLLALGLGVSGRLLADGGGAGRPAFVAPSRKLAGFGAIAFCALLIEGVANDWSAVFLRSAAGADESVAALGFAAFSLTMTVGRLLTDRVVARVGPRRFVRAAAAVSAAGLAVTLVADPAVSMAGFGLLGLGLAGTIPVVFSMAGNHDPDTPSGPAIAAVSTAGYGGFVTGPVLIGALAEFATVRAAFVPVLALAGLMALFTAGLPTGASDDRDGEAPA